MDLWGNEDEDEYRARKRAEIFSSSYHFENYGMLENAIHRCRLCPLCDEGGRGPVLSTGPVDAPLMIVGEGPGGVEDEYGGPLVGPSGQLLDKALLSVGITRDHVYVTNIVKCRPRGNRTPAIAEGNECGRRWLAEEIRLLGRAPDLTPAIRALAVDELRLRPEGFAGRAVPALIGTLVDIALVIELLKDFLNGLLMIIVRRADEFIIGDIHQLPQVFNAGYDMVDILLRRDPRGLRLLLNLLAVLVRAGEEHHVVPLNPFIPRHGIRHHGAVSVADVQIIRRIVDRRGDIKFLVLCVVH